MLPETFTQRIQGQLREEADLFFLALQQEAPVSVRINPMKPFAIPDLPEISWCSEGLYLSGRPSFILDPLWHAGAYYVQEASSMFIQQALRQILPGIEKPVALDLSAAPGGKSTLLVSELGQRGFLVANEVIQSRSRILAENLQRWGYPNVLVSNSDPSAFARAEGAFNLMMVDAPCSGEGMFRKDPASVNEWSGEHVQLCAARQQRILADVLPCLQQGGYLLYSTCTYNTNENEEILRWLNTQARWETVRLEIPPGTGIVETETDGLFAYRFYPHKVQGEGFFLSALKRLDGPEASAYSSKKVTWKALDKKQIPLYQSYVKGDQTFLPWGDEVNSIPEEWEEILRYLSQYIRFVQAGLPIGQHLGKELKPAAGLAFRTDLVANRFEHHELDLKEALHFLKKEDLKLPEAPTGWLLLHYRGIPLGFVKNLGNRTNNYYPKEWRILMNLPSPLPLPWSEVNG